MPTASPIKFRRSRAVSRILCPRLRGLRRFGEATTIPLVPSSLAGSSDQPGGMERAALMAPPYLVLLRAGFCLPPALPRARCALTAPFHPYPPPPAGALRSRRATAWQALSDVPRRSAKREVGRYVFCATFLQVTLTGRYPAHCPVEFGLSSLFSGRDPCGPGLKTAVVWLTAAEAQPLRSRPPGGCCTVRASYTDYCAACQLSRPFSRCSSRSRAVSG